MLSADTQDLLGIREFIERYPDRFVEVGIAEQNMIGVAAGLATVGLQPYVCGYAPFVTARSMEQVRNDVAYANQNVVIGAARQRHLARRLGRHPSRRRRPRRHAQLRRT